MKSRSISGITLALVLVSGGITPVTALAVQQPPHPIAYHPIVSPTPNCYAFVPTPAPGRGSPPSRVPGPGTGCGVTPAPTSPQGPIPGEPCVLTGNHPFQSCPPDPNKTPAPLNCASMAIGAREQVPACRDWNRDPKRGGYR